MDSQPGASVPAFGHATDARRRVPESLAAAVAAIIGLGISTYLTAAHYQDFSLACSTTGVIDCASVTHSGYSMVAGIPVSLLGVLWFGSIAACSLVTLRATARAHWLWTQVTLALGGLAFVLYLVYAELVQLHRICEWCTGVHLLTLTVFLLTVVRVQRTPSTTC